MEPLLPDGSFALFRSVKGAKRGDVVLVDHPELGLIVKKVAAVTVNGRIALRGISRASTSSRKLGSVERDCLMGRLALRMRWGRFLPRFSGPVGKGDDALDPRAYDQDEIDAISGDSSGHDSAKFD